jgi:transposase InsO family protein
MENQSKCRIQAIRSDNGKEYTLLEFNQYCEDASIEHQLMTPYTPEQHGVSERRNIYIMKMVRCLLYEKDLPKIFWVKTANTIVFLQNRFPTKVLKEKTLFEAWYDYKPSLSFLKNFGSIYYVHVP